MFDFVGRDTRALLAGERRFGLTRLYDGFDFVFLRENLKRFSRFPPDLTSGLSPFVFWALASIALKPNSITAKPRQSRTLIAKRGYELSCVKKIAVKTG